MSLKLHLKSIILCCLIIASYSMVNATTIRVDFSGTALSGPLSGSGYVGYFTFNSQLASPDANLVDFSVPDYEIGLSMDFGGTSWDHNNASVYELHFDSNSELIAFGLGGDVNHPHQFLVGQVDFRLTNTSGYYTVDGGGNEWGDSLSGLDWEISQTSPVPEPNTLMLFGIGCLSLAGVNRRKQ
jgi:hypothetical protein